MHDEETIKAASEEKKSLPEMSLQSLHPFSKTAVQLVRTNLTPFLNKLLNFKNKKFTVKCNHQIRVSV